MARPEKLSLIVYSGDVDKVHYALVLAASALATDTPATLFFTMGACRALTGSKDDPGWRLMHTSDGETGAHMDGRFRERGVGTFEELLLSTAEMGGRFMVCEMGLRAMGLARESLRADLDIAEGGVVTFLNDAEAEGAVVFI